MRTFAGVILPTIFQLIGFAIVVLISTGNGSFVGLAALSGAVIFVPAVLVTNILRGRLKPPIPAGRFVLGSFFFALIVPILLVILRVTEGGL
jgi:hypothetical protein